MNGCCAEAGMRTRKRWLIFAIACIQWTAFNWCFSQSWSPNGLYGNWTSMAMTSDGQKVAAASFISGIYVSTNAGTSWTNYGTPDSNHWATLASSANGNNLVAAFNNGGIYTSPDWGSNWLSSLAPTDTWSCLASSADGTRLIAGTSPGVLYTSKDGGATF